MTLQPKIGYYEWSNTNELVFKLNPGQEKRLAMIRGYIDEYEAVKRNKKKPTMISSPEETVFISLDDVKYVAIQKFTRRTKLTGKNLMHIESSEFDQFVHDLVRYFHYFIAHHEMQNKFVQTNSLPTEQHFQELDIVQHKLSICEMILGKAYTNLLISQGLSEFNIADFHTQHFFDPKAMESTKSQLIHAVICEIVNITFWRKYTKLAQNEVARLMCSKVFQKNSEKKKVWKSPRNESENFVSAASAHKKLSPILETVFPTASSRLSALKSSYKTRKNLPARHSGVSLTNTREILEKIDASSLVKIDEIGIVGQPKHLFTKGLYKIVIEEDSGNEGEEKLNTQEASTLSTNDDKTY